MTSDEWLQARGWPARCETNIVDQLGDCIVCSAVSGQACLRKPSLIYPPEPLNADGWTDWIKPQAGYRLQCCDCGSLHEMEFAVEDGAVVFRAKPIEAGETA